MREAMFGTRPERSNPTMLFTVTAILGVMLALGISHSPKLLLAWPVLLGVGITFSCIALIFNALAKVDYAVNRVAALFVQYDFQRQDSFGVSAGRDYDVNRVTVGLRLRR